MIKTLVQKIGLFKKNVQSKILNRKKEIRFERWMWIFLESGARPYWAHDGIDTQDLKDMIADAIRDYLIMKGK